MASPHICGLLAYLVSIEGTETFSILSGDSESQVDETEELAVFGTGTTSLYGKALSLLPKLAQSVLPAPATVQDEDAVRPTPPKKGELTPAKLKKALIALASPGKLIDQLPAGTPNLLAFNNATVAAKR
jgi:cerevisin